MKTISTLFLVILLIASNAFADGQNDYLRAAYSAYSSNDSNIVLAGSFEQEGLYRATNLNIATGTSETFQLDIDNNTELLDVQMNTKARLVYYFTNKKVSIYEFGATKSERVITIDNGSQNFGVSSDGSMIYSYDNNQGYVSIFDASNGERLDRFFVNSFKGGISEGFFNSEMDEFVLLHGNTLYVWSIANKVQDREITLSSIGKNFTFIDNGESMAYTAGGEVVLANSSDGEVTYRKQFEYKDIDNIQFSANMNYFIINNAFIDFTLFDMVNNNILVDSRQLRESDIYVPLYNYVNNDNSMVLANEIVSHDCGKQDEIPIATFSYYLYEVENYKKIVSAPTGYIPRPEKAIVSNDNSSVVITGSNFYHKKTNALVDNQENFIKYINVDAYPVTFLEDNDRIAFIEESKFRVYNIETEQYEREFDTGIDSINYVYFFPNNGGRLVINNNKEIKVFDYTNFGLLYTFNYSELGLEPIDISYDNNKTISVYSLKRLYKFDVYTGESSDSQIINNDPDNMLIDVSNSGRYLLYLTTDDSFMVYDSETKSEVFNNAPNIESNYITFLNGGFFGNHEIMWLQYEKNPMETDPLVVVYDFVTNETESLFGNTEPVISSDGGLYFPNYCPDKYEIGTIRDQQTSVETTNEAITGSVYPNPATDFIKLDMNASSLNSSIQIYDAYGKQVMSVIYTGENIDISKLTAGVYFVKMGNKSMKLIKL